MLLSCSQGLDFSSYVYGELNEEAFAEETGDGYRRSAVFRSVSSKDESFSSYQSILQREDEKGNRNYVIPSTGTQPLLVIPIDFSDCPSSSLPADAISRISRAFFGTPSSSFFSVASYYEESSYGRLQIKGKVAPSWFRAENPSSSYSSLSAAEQKAVLPSFYRSALLWYQETYPEDPLSNYAYLSESGESVVPVFFVYSLPYDGMESGKTSRSSFFWAFSMNRPAPISFASYYMMDDQATSRTYVHEVGHLFGLKDYYDEGSNEAVACVSPLGRCDMMDASMGDHNPFSKMLLDWARPIEVTSSCRVKIRSFSASGDFVLLSPSWNGSPFDEYLLLSFYSPFGLNGYDGKKGKEASASLPDAPGVMAYRVNGRLGVYENSSLSYSSPLSETSQTKGKRVDLAYSNNIGDVSNASRALIQLLDASGSSSSLCPYYVASSVTEGQEGMNRRAALFQKGQGFQEGSFSDFVFHDGEKLGYSFTVEEVTSTYAAISFAKRD